MQRREEIRVIAECPNDRHWAQEMRRAVAELLAHIDALEQAAAERVIADGGRGLGVAPAVAIPAWDASAFASDCIKAGSYFDDEIRCVIRGAEIGYNYAASRAIPSDRVLGDGMRQVDASRFERMQAEEAERHYLLELERYVRAMAKLQNWSKDTTDHGPLSSLDRLRANQGGAAT